MKKKKSVSQSHITSPKNTQHPYCVLNLQVVIGYFKSVRSRISSNKGKSHAPSKPTDGQRYCMVPQALGKDLPPGG